MRNYIAVFLFSLLCLPSILSARSVSDIPFTTTERPWIVENDFLLESTLHATRHQTVVLDLESSGLSKGTVHKNSVPILVEEDRLMSFCIPDDEPHIKRLKFKRMHSKQKNKHKKRQQASAHTVLQLRKGDDCPPLLVSAGRYMLEIFHDEREILSESRQAFIYRPATHRLFGSSTFDSGTPDYMAFSGPNGQFVSDNTTSPLLALIPQSTNVSAHEIWQFQPIAANHGSKYALVNAAGNKAKFFSWCCSNAPVYSIFTGEIVGSVGDTHEFQTRVIDLGNGQFQLQLAFTDPNVTGNFFESPIWLDNNSDNLRWKGNNANSPDATIFTYAYKGFADGSTLSLQQGEIALFVKCNYEGAATVFQADVSALTIFNTAAELGMGLGDNMAASIKVGPNTIAHLYTDADFGGETEGFGSDVACFDDNTLIGNGTTSSLKIDALDEYIISSNGCERCILSGIDLSNQDLSNMNFSESVLIGANLSNTDLQNTNLTDTDLSTANTILTGANFTGAELLCTKFISVDLTVATFANNNLIRDHSCYLDLSNSKLDYAIFDLADWRYFDLTASTMSNVPQTLSTKDTPLDLSGGIFNSVNWLSGKTLDNINLGCYPLEENQMTVCPTPLGSSVCSTLQGIVFSNSSLKSACLANASMEGVFLGSSNLDGANLSGAQLQALTGGKVGTLDGAFMRNVILTGANLTGVSAQNVNFYTASGGEASADNLTAPGANFSGAYLAGANFSSLNNNLQSTNWSNAMLINANFSQADLTTNTSGGVNSGTNTTFKGAYLQGAQFSEAQLDDVSFLDTYWDAADSNGKVNILIPNDNLGFTGYWKDTSLPECPPTLTNINNVLPTETTIQNTCPNNQPGPCEENDWLNPAQNMSNAFFKSAHPDSFPQDLNVSADKQCGTTTNPADLCWLISNNPSLCPEN